MKKLVLLIFIFLSRITASGQTASLLTLNGYLYKDAVAMREAFRTSNVNPPKATSIWFSREVIKNMLNLLTSEKAPNGSSPDGIRIYFGYLNNKITVLLVSTYAFGQDNSVHSGTYHQDYFEHDSNNTLYSTENVNGIVSDIGSSGPGALLYKDCGTPCLSDRPCLGDGIHYVKRSYGQAMVQNFGTANIVTKSEWFDLDMLKAVDAANNYDGIRIYLGRHPAGDINVENQNHEAFVLVTTNGKNPDNQTDNFDCLNIKSLADNLKVMKEKNAPGKMHTNLIPNLSPYFFNGQDNGEVCPIHCQGATLQ